MTGRGKKITPEEDRVKKTMKSTLHPSTLLYIMHNSYYIFVFSLIVIFFFIVSLLICLTIEKSLTIYICNKLKMNFSNF